MNVVLAVLILIALTSAGFALESSSVSASGSSSSPSAQDGSGNEPTNSEMTGSNGMRLSASQIALYAANAGFADEDLKTAIAVALAESGGDPEAYNPEKQAGTPDGLGSVGLWQIYQYRHPEFQGEDLTDPQTNANAAFSIYDAAGRSFRPWSTYKSQAYLTHFAEAQAAVNA